MRIRKNLAHLQPVLLFKDSSQRAKFLKQWRTRRGRYLRFTATTTDAEIRPPYLHSCFGYFATEFLFDFGIRLFPEGRKVLCYLNGPVIWRQDLHNDRDASTTNA